MAQSAPQLVEELVEETELLEGFAVTVAEEDLLFVAPEQQSGAVRTKELVERLTEEGFTLGYLVPDTNTMQFKRD